MCKLKKTSLGLAETPVVHIAHNYSLEKGCEIRQNEINLR